MTGRTARIEIRATVEQKAAIEAAAAIEGRTVADFSLPMLVERAEAVIQRDRQLQVSAAQFDEFLTILERPARDVAGLRELLTRPSVFID